MKTWQRRILGFYTLGGGAIGLSSCLTTLVQGAPRTGAGTAILAIGLALFAWGIWCGFAMLEGAPAALRRNRLFWAVQIPLLQTPIVGYSFFTGTQLPVVLAIDPIKFGFHMHFLGAQFGLSLGHSGQPVAVGLNVLALGVTAFLAGKLGAAGR